MPAATLLALVGLLIPPAATSAQTAAPVWRALASVEVVAEPTTFSNAGARLAGTLYLPAGGRALGAMVVTHAAASPLRTSPLYVHLTQLLPSLGIAVLVYDRRGAGASEGQANSGDFALLADDAIAAVRMLKRDPRIDPRRIGVWGLSQGGWLALLAAARSPDVRFIVPISAPVVTADVQMLFRTTNAMRVNGYTQSDIDQMTATRNAVDAYMRGAGEQGVAQARVDAARDKPWFKYLYLGPVVRDRAVAGWRKEIENDPLLSLRQVRVPALILFGANDPVVPVAISVARLRTVAPRHRDMRVAVIAGADHGMQTGVSAKDFFDPARVDTMRPNTPEYVGLLASWLTGHGISRLPAR